MIWGKVFKHWELLSKAFVEPSQTSFPFFFFFALLSFPFFYLGLGSLLRNKPTLGQDLPWGSRNSHRRSHLFLMPQKSKTW